MTDKEFKRLTRSQLIDIIYQLQLKQEELTAENEKLTNALDDKRLRVDKAGNIAEAALEIHNVMKAAQDAAAHYLEEIQMKADQEYQRIVQLAKDEAAAILENAQQEASEILQRANNANIDYDPLVEAILKEWQQPI
jgi:cell division septum initiation protein DivIVA